MGIFRGSLQNKIHRWYSCFEKYQLDYAMLVDADDPIFCFSLMNEALEKLSKNEAEIISTLKIFARINYLWDIKARYE